MTTTCYIRIVRRSLAVSLVSLLVGPLLPEATGQGTNWVSGFGAPGVDGTVKSILRVGDSLFIGGTGRFAGQAFESPRLVILDLTDSSYHDPGAQLGSVSGSEIKAIAYDSASHSVLVGGYFTSLAGQDSLKHLARLDLNTRTWGPVGASADGVEHMVNAIAVEDNGNIYIGGQFDSVSNMRAQKLARWVPGAGWEALAKDSLERAGSSEGEVHALDLTGDTLWVGGRFDAVDSVTPKNIVGWHDSTWLVLPEGGVNNAVYDLDAWKYGTGGGPEIHVAIAVGGAFTMAGDTLQVPRYVVYRSTGNPYWYPTPALENLSGFVYEVQVDAFNVGVWLGGNFTYSDSSTTYSLIYVRNGINTFGEGLTAISGGIGECQALFVDASNNTHVGGRFDKIDGRHAGNLATIDASLNTHVYGQGAIGPQTGPMEVRATAVDAAGVLYVAGTFTGIGNIDAPGLAMWDGSTWTAFPAGPDQRIFNLEVIHDTLYAVGSFTQIGAQALDHVAKWDGTQWLPVGNLGTTGEVYTIADGNDGYIYVGGYLSGLTSPVARWDGTTWESLPPLEGGGASVWVNDIHVRPNGYVLAGGVFDGYIVQGQPFQQSHGLVGWQDGNVNWESWNGYMGLGDTVFGEVFAIAQRGANIYVAGDLGGNGFSQRLLGFTENICFVPRSIVIGACDMYVGGVWDSASICTGNTILRITTEGFDYMDGGINSGLVGGNLLNRGVLDMSIAGDQLIAGGDFWMAGNQPARSIAVWNDAVAAPSVISWVVPSMQDTLWYGNTAVFSWPAADTFSAFRLQYSWDNKANWSLEVANYDPTLGAYIWEVPYGINSDTVYFRLADGISCFPDEFGPYVMRDVPGLTVQRIYRQYPGGELVPFDPRVHGWNFVNSGSNMWPDSYVDSIDYSHLPQHTAEVIRHFQGGATLFQDWNLFTDSWGDGACYYAHLEPRMDAVSTWSGRQKKFFGSCFGFSVMTQSYFAYDRDWWNLSSGFPGYRFLNEIPLGTVSRNLINEFVVKQRQTDYRKHQRDFWETTPGESLDSLLTYMGTLGQGVGGVYPMLVLKNWKEVTDEVDKVGHFAMAAAGAVFEVASGHVVVPYKITNDPDTAGLVHIYVYDCNKPNTDTVQVRINLIDGTWSFRSWGYFKGIIPGPRWQAAHGAELGKVSARGGYMPPGPTAAADTVFVSLETSEWNDVLISTPLGDSLGQVTGQGLIRNSTFGIPLIDEGPDYEFNRPPGYFFPATEVEVTLSAFDSSFTYVGWDEDSTYYFFERNDASQSQVDILAHDSTWSYSNPDSLSKSITMLAVGVSPTYSWVAELQGVDVGAQTDFAVQRSDDTVKIFNGSSQVAPNLYMASGSDLGTEQVQANNVLIPSGATVAIIPQWQQPNLGTILMLMDAGGDGTYEDTLVLAVTTSAEDAGGPQIPGAYALGQNYPNPFNPSTTIRFSLPIAAHVEITIYNVLGQQVRQLVNEEHPAGQHAVKWNGRDRAGLAVPSGMYFYRIETDGFSSSKKMLLLR